MPQENGSGGPRGGGGRGRDGGPGQGPRREGAGGFGGREGGFGGREGGRGRGDGPGRGRGRGRDEERSFGPGQRVIAELGVLEKALSKSDFASQKGPLEAIVRSLRPMRLKSLEDLDLNTRGRLITTLARVPAKMAGKQAIRQQD